MKEKFKKVKMYLIISSIVWIVLLIFTAGIKDTKIREILTYILGITFTINLIIWIVYKVKRKKYKFYTIKENGKTVEVEEKEE